MTWRQDGAASQTCTRRSRHEAAKGTKGREAAKGTRRREAALGGGAWNTNGEAAHSGATQSDTHWASWFAAIGLAMK